MKNLDLIAAQAAQAIISSTRTKKYDVNNVENLVTKALGVLQENGVYASMLYLYSRSNAAEKPIAEECRYNLLSITSELGLQAPARPNASTALKFLTDRVCNDLDRLLLVKQLWEQTLIYTRYGAKAWSAEKTQEDKLQVDNQEVKLAEDVTP
ncbi:MAG: hypothetical protein ACR2H5_02770 [Ktedonobacteraceae bacterium]